MRYLNRGLGALGALGLMIGGSAAAQQRPVGVPSIPAPGADAAPPPDMPHGEGPSATSGSAANGRFDEVGYAVSGNADMTGVSVAAAALGAGSYAEITALDTGKVILAEVAPGAPPSGRLALLSPRAMAALGVAATGPVPVRIRTVQPQAGDGAALKRGQLASPRLDAPASLLTGLRARLAEVATPAAVAARPKSDPAPAKSTPAPAKPTATRPATTKPPAKAAGPAKPAASGRYHVQVAAFASEANARKLAGQLDGHVEAAGKYWRVELGPFTTSSAAQQARDAVAKRGYGDARVRKD